MEKKEKTYMCVFVTPLFCIVATARMQEMNAKLSKKGNIEIVPIGIGPEIANDFARFLDSHQNDNVIICGSLHSNEDVAVMIARKHPLKAVFANKTGEVPLQYDALVKIARIATGPHSNIASALFAEAEAIGQTTMLSAKEQYEKWNRLFMHPQTEGVRNDTIAKLIVSKMAVRQYEAGEQFGNRTIAVGLVHSDKEPELQNFDVRNLLGYTVEKTGTNYPVDVLIVQTPHSVRVAAMPGSQCVLPSLAIELAQIIRGENPEYVFAKNQSPAYEVLDYHFIQPLSGTKRLDEVFNSIVKAFDSAKTWHSVRQQIAEKATA
jgi:hypothetical protein